MSTTFKTYVDIDEYDTKANGEKPGYEDAKLVEPHLLPGEVIIAVAPSVLRYAVLSDRKQGKSGTLFVTNFKVTFIDPQNSPTEGQRNKILNSGDICLANVESLYHVSGEKRRRLVPGASAHGSIKCLQIVCRDFRVVSFGFRFSSVGSGRTLANAILHHAFPTRLELVFAFECLLPASQLDPNIAYFNQDDDWLLEVERCGCNQDKKWRLCTVNENYQVCPSLCEAFIVPAALTDELVTQSSQYFLGQRPPVWVWGNDHGCVIIRMARSLPTAISSQEESVLLERIRATHPTARESLILELDRIAPSLKDVAGSWSKLRDHCCAPPNSFRRFTEQDTRYLSLLEASQWPQCVTSCLRIALRAAKSLCEDSVSVVLQEGEGRDMSALISSLTQIIIDPHYRTLHGFQSLIQKEWVALGHPFASRLGRFLEKDNEEVPLFHLFLDCVWQLTQQCPTAFEFTETYLTSLWDATFVSLFDTFLFSSHQERVLALEDDTTCFQLRGVWDWDLQLGADDQLLFYNPTFAVSQRVQVGRQMANVSPVFASVNFAPHETIDKVATGYKEFASPNLGSPDYSRSRRSSVSTLTLSRKDGPVFTGEGTDTLGRSWGSRNFAFSDWYGGKKDKSSGVTWSKVRGLLFFGHEASFSPNRLQKNHLKSVSGDVAAAGRFDEHEMAFYKESTGASGPPVSSSAASRALQHTNASFSYTHSNSGAAAATTPSSIARFRKNGETSLNQRWTVYESHGLGSASIIEEASSSISDHISSASSTSLTPSSQPATTPNSIHNQKPTSVHGQPDWHLLDWPVYKVLSVTPLISAFRLWKQCYLRAVPALDIRGGGDVVSFLQMAALSEQILSLEKSVVAMEEKMARLDRKQHQHRGPHKSKSHSRNALFQKSSNPSSPSASTSSVRGSRGSSSSSSWHRPSHPSSSTGKSLESIPYRPLLSSSPMMEPGGRTLSAEAVLNQHRSPSVESVFANSPLQTAGSPSAASVPTDYRQQGQGVYQRLAASPGRVSSFYPFSTLSSPTGDNSNSPGDWSQWDIVDLDGESRERLDSESFVSPPD